MTSERPYRERLSLGGTLSEIVRLAPQKFDPNIVHALLVQVRRDAVGSNRVPFLEGHTSGIAAADIDQLSANLQHKISHGRLFLT
jgi:HD-GYP domain-containing protein (c-di-GMP phosphodiesterase class II)